MTTTNLGTGEQPWFVIHATSEVYQYAPDVPGVSQIYRFQAGDLSDGTFAIPDGCVDIMFDCSEQSPSAKICGSTISAQNAKLQRGHVYFGIRFHPGTILKSIDIPTKHLISQRLNLSDVMQDKNCLLEQLIEQKTFINQVEIIKKHLARDALLVPSIKTQTALKTIIEHNGNIQIIEVEQKTGISKRTLQRLFNEEIGVSPKAFSRIIRCQSAIGFINQMSDLKLIELANDLGFSDQPHFMREFKKLINATPCEYQRQLSNSSYASRIQTL